MKVAFAGTPEFARVALEAIAKAGFEIVLVLTQPDRPAGRGMKLQPSPVKAFAQAQGLALCQPAGLKLDGKYAVDAQAARAALEAVAPDVIVVAAYGLILPPWLLELAPLGCINIHASLLPRWRGAAPIHRAIEAGDARTGITVMQMDAGLDTGAMLLTEAIDIAPRETTATLLDRLAPIGGRLIVQALQMAAAGRLQPVAQPAEGITYAHKIDKSEALIDWTLPADVIERRIRAFDPFPGASTTLSGQPLKCWRAELAPDSLVFVTDATASAESNDGAPRLNDGAARRALVAAPGSVTRVGSDGVTVACGSGALTLTELQRPGARRLPVAQFLAAGGIAEGSVLG
jgi:methionyl-tRNA formyltransferase